MKHVLWLAGVAAVLTACNNNTQNSQQQGGGTTTQTDTASHSARQDATDVSAAGVQSPDTAAMAAATAGGSLMSIMQHNMNELKNMSSTGNPDTDFATMMKTHHMGSIEMGQMEISQGSDPQVKQMAQKMVQNQQKEVDQLNSFLNTQTPQGGGDAFHKEAMNSMRDMKLEAGPSGTVDQQFARLMAEHHKGGIEMGQAYVKHSKEERLKALANKIMSEQKKELRELQDWLNKNQ